MPDGIAASGGNTIRYTLRAPVIAQLQRTWQITLATKLAAVSTAFHAAATGAYSGTRFAATFTPASTWRSVTLMQTNPLFTVVEWPTKAHPIIAHNALYDWLVFKVNGRWVRAKRVYHPGTKGRNAMESRFQAMARAFEQAVLDAGWQVLSNGL